MIIVISVTVMLHLISQSTAVLYDEYILRASYFKYGMRRVSVVKYMFIQSDGIHLLLKCACAGFFTSIVLPFWIDMKKAIKELTIGVGAIIIF